ncbi:helix-turn-helix domain-containing protein [Pelagibacterium sp. 26DY04]|jgi:predicted transcriptional regulator|uniref:Helix-turn-helix transcriptional regulator n=2 Tax=Devosiaceae TaxID=2831106 RepID=A0ABZ2I1Z3_9HYPH|nr:MULTISPECIES: helix-turn-helix transcriptional regulator [Devosiaceae]QYO77313.1 helix-turn-helix domain-containing protein [Devosia salina]WMT85536.1 helix-turn-helix domain-containing protein [Pelagibacterium sp. 26DY04]|tara:strand:- start:2783 stop:3070 length:288 start_codon:yes stop_codon:yes gene_type:complete
MTSLNELKKDLLKRADVRAEYESLAEEFSIAEALIRARSEADLTQTELAERMHTSQSYIAKLESGRVSPSMKALQRYAAATGSRLKISLERAVSP